MKPVIGITMGDPVGIGPEIIVKALFQKAIGKICTPVIFGDAARLEQACNLTETDLAVNQIGSPDQCADHPGCIDVVSLMDLDTDSIDWGTPTVQTGKAMFGYIDAAIHAALKGVVDGVVTCPINKKALQAAGFMDHGHTEIFARYTHTTNYAMMFSGRRLNVVLVTIHTALKNVAEMLTVKRILDVINLTDLTLKSRFKIPRPRIAVAGFNPHAGESGRFGKEEDDIIKPAIQKARQDQIDATGPYPPDTIFHQAASGAFDIVVSMYHDQGLIPFKLLHFDDGVNITIGLPIIRTSVDHGTAYDIAGTGQASPESLIAAVESAVFQAKNMAC